MMPLDNNECTLPRRHRDATIDVFKGLLTLLMIAAHVIQLLGSSGHAAEALSLAANLTCFPAFVFCFGFAVHRAYLNPSSRGRNQRIAATILKILGAYYLSAGAWLLFVDKEASVGPLLDVLLFQRIPPYSEFLLAFAATLLIALPLRRALLGIASSDERTIVAACLLLLTTSMPYASIQNPPLSLFIGSTSFTVFPVLQYFLFFLLGVHTSILPQTTTPRATIIATCVLVLFLFHITDGGTIPDRFPPSPLWILLSLPPLAIGVSVAKRIGQWAWARAFLAPIGTRVLFYLVISNVLLFAALGSYPDVHLALPWAIVIFATLVGIIIYLTSLIRSSSTIRGATAVATPTA